MVCLEKHFQNLSDNGVKVLSLIPERNNTKNGVFDINFMKKKKEGWTTKPIDPNQTIKPSSSARYIYENNKIIALVYNCYDAEHICRCINEKSIITSTNNKD